MESPSERQRRLRITVRVSRTERAALDAAAERSALTLSAYARAILTSAKPLPAARRPPVEAALLARVLGQLGKIGSNLNQIAHAANSIASGVSLMPFSERELLRSLAELRTIRPQLLAALGRAPSSA